MYTLKELREILKSKSIEKVNDDVFDLGDYMAILTTKKVYIGSDFYYRPTIADEKYLNSAKFRREYNQVEENVFESKKSPGPVAIRVGNHMHIFLDEWKRINRKSFMRSLK